jgi:hypothetical protein
MKIPFAIVFLFVLVQQAEVAKAQAQSPLDLTIQSCVDFSTAESHLDAAYHVVTKGYKTIPGKKEPVAEIEGVETPEKMKEFMDWYANGGSSEMLVAGSKPQARGQRVL